MKHLATLTLLLMILFSMPSCKKDDTTANNNNSNPGNGLGSLAPVGSANYCVLILEGNDTMIWTGGVGGVGGVEGSSGGDLFFSLRYLKNTLTNNWQQVGFAFQMPEKFGYTQPSCDYIDSLIRVGNVTLSPSNGNYMWLTYSDGTSVESWFNLSSATCQIVSVTTIPASSGCYSLRTKIDIANMDIDFNPFCAVYHTHIVKGELVMDFNVNQ